MHRAIHLHLLLLLAALFAAVAPVRADDIQERYPIVSQFFPDADRFGELTGNPAAGQVYAKGRLIGFIFFSKEIVTLPAYSGKPINNLIGLRVDGRIAGVAVVEHEEPLLLGGIPPGDLERYVRQYRGKSAFDEVVVGAGSKDQVAIDAISGATITTMVENATVMRAARAIARSRHLPLAQSHISHAPHPHENANAIQATAKTGGTVAIPAQATEYKPLWRAVWHARSFRIAVLGAGLALLTMILLFQDWLARHPRLLVYVRDGFLVFTIIFIGWYALGQLSVINVLTFTHAVMGGFNWESFLLEPTMFILWSFVAVSLLLWGRGVYCGWLCPFGAIQELVQQLARKLRVPQFEFPYVVHERLWALKYIVLLALFAVSLQSLGSAERYAEIEPFKTVNLRFARDWGYVAFAAGMILISAFNRKLYCKYICPLGAALTIPARFRIFDWLRRRKECGSPCQVCASECEVQAVRPTGEINANECHYCLDCQVTYWNDHKCPPLCEKRKRHERSGRARELVAEMAPNLGYTKTEGTPVRVVHKPDDPTPRG